METTASCDIRKRIMMTTTQSVLSALVATLLVASTALAAEAKRGSFAEFDARARAGARLSVVFFGASLTWSANASDPVETSYRAVMRDQFEAHYPAAHFRFRDSAIGGTGSQLGAFRLDRDVLAHKPDLVFLDFTANDDINSADPETLASYESILRRMANAGILVVQVAFPFKWDIETSRLPKMKRLIAHRALADTYGNGWGDAVTRICREVDAGRLTREALWVTDGVHPHDPGYREFAAAAWDGYLAAVKAGRAPRVPAQPVYAETYLTLRRFNLAGLPNLPRGWSKGRPNLTAANHDWLMSRWLDDLIVARNRNPDQPATPGTESKPVQPLRLNVEGSVILLFGESTADSGRFRVLVDSVAVTGQGGQEKGADWFEGNRWKTGNGFLLWEVARGLDPSVPHLLEIEPVFDNAKAQELKIESICVAGGKARVAIARQ
jgi:lysophospholipase L1-like esterase